MSFKLESLKQRITKLEAKNLGLRIKLSVSDAEIAELKCRNAEVLRVNAEYNERRDVEKAKLKARIEELESEFRDRITKVEQKQMLNELRSSNSSNDNIPNDNTSNNNSSNFNSGAVHHEKRGSQRKLIKLSEEKNMDNFLLEAHKKIVGEDIR